MSFMEAEGMGHSAPGKVGIFCRHSAQPALVVRARASRQDLSSAVSNALAELKRLLPRARGDEQAPELPFIAYYAISADTVEIEVGVPLDKSLARIQGQAVTSIPMGRYVSAGASFTHGAVAQTYRELADWFARNEEHCTGPVYTTLVPSSGSNGESFLVQRRICAGPALSDDADAGISLCSPDASELAQTGLSLLAHEKAYN